METERTKIKSYNLFNIMSSNGRFRGVGQMLIFEIGISQSDDGNITELWDVTLFRVRKFNDCGNLRPPSSYFCLEYCSNNYFGNTVKIARRTPVTLRHGHLLLLISFRCRVLLIEITVASDCAEILYTVIWNLVLRFADTSIYNLYPTSVWFIQSK